MYTWLGSPHDQTFGNMDEVAFVHSPPEELAFYDAALIPKPIVTDYENAIPARSFRQGMGSYNPINVSMYIV